MCGCKGDAVKDKNDMRNYYDDITYAQSKCTKNSLAVLRSDSSKVGFVEQKRTLLFSIEPGYGVSTSLALKGLLIQPLIRK